MSDDDLIRRGDVYALFKDWLLYWPSGQNASEDICAEIAALPAVTAPQWLLSSTDDGADTFLDWYAGGANPAGEFGRLGLCREWLDGRVEYRNYTADSAWLPAGGPAALAPAQPAPYMTDLMVDPESIDAFLEANPLTPKPVDDSLAADPAVKPAQKESDGDMLDRLGMDGVKWAAEFRTTALRLGYSDMDEGWLIGWFCNAIMAGYDRRKPTLAEALEVPEVKVLVEAANEHIAFMEGTGLTFDFLGKLRAALRQIGGAA